MTDKEIIARQAAKIIELEDKLANSIPIKKYYEVGDLAAILKDVMEENQK